MKRRDFLQLMAASSLTAHSMLMGEEISVYEGELFLILQADGGWDVSSYCDPKADANFNSWAKDSEIIQTSSEIAYAPFANNAMVFEKYHNDMLIVNGIDTQTNAHNAGVRHMFSGRFDEGYPAFGALFSAIKAPNLALSYISNGSYNYTDSLIKYTLLQNPSALANIIEPNKAPYSNAPFSTPKERAIIDQYIHKRALKATNDTTTAPRLATMAKNFLEASASKSSLSRLKHYLPKNGELEPLVDESGNYNPLPRQAQLLLVAMKAGVCSSGDLRLGGFDTHANHDKDHSIAIGHLNSGIDYIFKEATRLGIVDRLTLFISSDFSRTPSYNDGRGKDHWPTASAIFMKKGASWGGRIYGTSDADIGALPLNADLKVDTKGVIPTPAHLQRALRKLAGIDIHAITQNYPLHDEGLDLSKMFL